MYSFASQSIGLDSIVNARELGGYVLPDGRTVKRGLLLRGGSLFGATPEDLSALSEKFHVLLNFDIRTEEEISAKPDPEIEGIRRIWLPTIDMTTEKKAGAYLPDEAFKNLGAWLLGHASDERVLLLAKNLYVNFVENEYSQLQFAAIIENIVNTDGGAVFWHCTQGKDRTGLAACFLLAALGADRKLIVEDFLISGEVFKPLLDKCLASVSSPEATEVLQTFVSVNLESFNLALDTIDLKFGSMENYLRGPLCLTDEDFSILREKYTC